MPELTKVRWSQLKVGVVAFAAMVILAVLIFLLTLLRVVSPRFLLRHSRYAILGIVIAAAIITPTPDVFNLMLFAIPMCALYFVGVFCGYLLVLRREGKKFPWKSALKIAGTLKHLGQQSEDGRRIAFLAGRLASGQPDFALRHCQARDGVHDQQHV